MLFHWKIYLSDNNFTSSFITYCTTLNNTSCTASPLFLGGEELTEGGKSQKRWPSELKEDDWEARLGPTEWSDTGKRTSGVCSLLEGWSVAWAAGVVSGVKLFQDQE